MLLCVTIIQYNVCFNGSLIGLIKPKRGLRQGDPISPYLFLMCVDGLSKFLKEAEVNGGVHGCQVHRNVPAVIHLQMIVFSFFEQISHRLIRSKLF